MGNKPSGGKPPKRRIVDARADKDGDITHVKFAGNQRYTSADKAIEIAKRDGIENAHVVNRRNAREHLRTNPDNSSSNNLDNMAGDT